MSELITTVSLKNGRVILPRIARWGKRLWICYTRHDGSYAVGETRYQAYRLWELVAEKFEADLAKRAKER